MKKTRFTEVEFQKIKLGKNDTLLLTVSSSLSGEEVWETHELVRGLFLDNKIVTMPEGFKLEAITQP